MLGPSCCQAKAVSDSTFYSDRVGKATPRTSEDVSESAWYGLAALIHGYLSDGSLARAFPEQDCPDGNSITGTDEELFLDSLAGFIPGISRDVLIERQLPDTTTVLDIIDFIALRIDQPSSRSSHSFFRHEHLHFGGHNAHSPFDELLTPGQTRFRQDIDLLFHRNGIAFTVGDDMRVHRLGPPRGASAVLRSEAGQRKSPVRRQAQRRDDPIPLAHPRRTPGRIGEALGCL